MRAFDVFVLSSLGEGISYTMLEAMASGLPVVATRVGGNVELVDEGITGTLVPSSDPAALEAAMEAYFRDRAMAQRHGRAGRAKVESQFTECSHGGPHSVRTEQDCGATGLAGLG